MRRSHGFTVIEIAIVLTIIGLLIGGILAGQSIMRASELRGALSEYDRFVKAIDEFQSRYLALPGDMSTAEDMWGSDASCPNTASNTVTKKATCNGDGGGTIGSSNTSGSLSNSREWFRAWQQLANAGLIPSQYTGAPGPNDTDEAVPGVNVPKSELNGGGWTLNYILMTSNGGLYADSYGHLLHLGAYTENSYTINPVLTPQEARALDEKIDDAMPGKGKVRAWRTSVLAQCTETDTSQAAQAYKTSYTDPACSVIFLLGF